MNTMKRGKTRPDTRLPQSRAGGQGLYFRLPNHLGRSSDAKHRKKTKKVKCDERTNGRTNGLTKRVVGQYMVSNTLCPALSNYEFE